MTPIPIITDLDAARLRELGAHLPDGGRGLGELGELLGIVSEEAEIVPRQRVAADVVTVNSIISIRDEVTGAAHRICVVYPRDFSIGERRISVLSPVGRAVLGQKVGSVATVAVPGGTRAIRIVALHYQPEAAGDEDL